jgi:hypothetical protein
VIRAPVASSVRLVASFLLLQREGGGRRATLEEIVLGYLASTRSTPELELAA